MQFSVGYKVNVVGKLSLSSVGRIKFWPEMLTAEFTFDPKIHQPNLILDRKLTLVQLSSTIKFYTSEKTPDLGDVQVIFMQLHSCFIFEETQVRALPDCFQNKFRSCLSNPLFLPPLRLSFDDTTIKIYKRR